VRLAARPWRWIAAAAAITLAGLTVGNLPGNAEGLPAAPAPLAARRPAGAVSPASAIRPPAPDGPAAVAAAAPPPPDLAPGLASALMQWNAGRGGAAMAVLSSAVGSATQAAGLQFYAALRQACGQVATAVADAKNGPPIPDPALQRQYAKGLVLFTEAAAGCESGVSVRPDGDEDLQTQQNRRVLHLSGAEFARGGTALYEATAAIRELVLSKVTSPAPPRGSGPPAAAPAQ
jgi:hypothetical protein